MQEIHVDAKNIVNERLFSADGSNTLFDHIYSQVQSFNSDDSFSVVIDFYSIDLVSTSFVGRFQEHIVRFKHKYINGKLKIINIKPEIKRQFTKHST